jgi:hypothetical protein
MKESTIWLLASVMWGVNAGMRICIISDNIKKGEGFVMDLALFILYISLAYLHGKISQTYGREGKA